MAVQSGEGSKGVDRPTQASSNDVQNSSNVTSSPPVNDTIHQHSDAASVGTVHQIIDYRIQMELVQGCASDGVGTVHQMELVQGCASDGVGTGVCIRWSLY